MKLKNAISIILNILCGLFSCWYFLYALVFITDRKDAESEEFVPVGYAMLITGILTFIIHRTIQLLRTDSKKDYFTYSILPMLASFVLMSLFIISYELKY